MEDKAYIKYNEKEIILHEFNSMRHGYTEHRIDLLDRAVIDALIDLGWTPPNKQPVSTK